MGVSVPLKLKDSAGLQSIDSDNYDFLAYRAGLQLVGLDSNAVAGYGIRDANTDKRDIGDIINTFYDSATGTHGPDALFSATSITTNLYQGTGTLEYTDSNYRNFLYQTDSALDSGSQKYLQAFTDDDWTNLNNSIVSRMVKKDYPGVIYLGDSDFDSANGSWSKLISNFYSDTRTSGDAINYHIWQKQYLTDSVPSDSAKPFTMKYRADSAEINIAGAFKDIGRDSDLPNSKGRYYPSSTGVLSNTGLNRVAMAFTSLNSQQEFDSNSFLTLALDKEWNDKIYGVWQRANGPAGRGAPRRFTYKLKHYQQTQFSTAPNNSTYIDKRNNNSSTIHVYKDSANDTLPNRLGSRPQVWLGVKGRVDLVDSARFGSSAATFAATDATMQSYVESDGKWSFHFNFDSDATFIPKRVTDLTDGIPNSFSQGGTYIYDSEGVVNLGTGQQYADVLISRPGYNYLQFPSAYSGNKAGQITTDSSTTAIIKQARSNGHFGLLLSSFPTQTNFKGIGYDSADEINLILKNDFLGFQIADSDQLDETLNKRVRNYLADTTTASNPPIGTYLLRSSGDGTPSQSGILGTWEPKGVATDFRNQIIDVNYTRASTNVFDIVRSSSFTDTYSAVYAGERTSNFTDGFLGNYDGIYTRERDQDFARTRTSLYEGQYVGNYTGNYSGQIVATGISTVGSGSYPRTIIQTGGVPVSVYTGDGGTGYLGSASNETARTIVVAQSNPQTDPASDIPSQGSASTPIGSGNVWDYRTESETAIAYSKTATVGGAGSVQSFTIDIYVDGARAKQTTGTGGVSTGDTFGQASAIGTFYFQNGGNAPFSGSSTFIMGTKLGSYNSGGYRHEFWQVKLQGTYYSYSISSQTAGTGWSNNAATIDTNDGRVSSPAQYKEMDFIRDYDGNYDGNYAGDFLGNYTGDFLGNYEGQFTRTITADYTGDFIGNYDGEFATDFVGNYEGAYETDYQGNFAGEYQGNYTGVDSYVTGGNALTILSTHVASWGNAAGTTRTIGFQVPSGTRSVVVMSNVGTNSSRYTRLNSVSFLTPALSNYSMTKVESAYSGNAEYSFESSIFAFSAAGIDTPSQFNSRAGSITVTHSNNTQVYGASVKILFLNKAFTNHNPTSPTYWQSKATNITSTQGGVSNHRFYIGGLSVAAATVYNAPSDGNTFIGVTSAGSNKSFAFSDPVEHVGNRDGIYGYEVVTNGSGVLTNNSVTPVSDGTSTYVATSTRSGRHRNDFGETQVFVSWRPQAFTDNTFNYTRNSTRTSTRTSTGTYIGLYDRTRTSLYEGTYTRERDTDFQSGDAFSSVYSADYTGNYQGNYTSDYTGNYEGNFTGDFIGTTIGTDKSSDAYETFTLYVKVG